MDSLAPQHAPHGIAKLVRAAAARLRRRASPAEAARARAKRQSAILARGALALPYLQLLLAVAGLLQFFAIPLPLQQLLKKSYIDENAFQPGQVNTYFSWSDVSAADRYADGLQAFVQGNDSIGRSSYIVQQLQEQGLSAFTQDYNTDRFQVTRNVYTRLHSPKTSGAEVVVLCAPWVSREAGMNNVRGTATLLALAKHFQRLSMWSKDIILLFSDGSTEGAQAWLRAYHGEAGHRINPLPSASGSIWSAITVDYPYHSFSHIGLYYDGINGRLPNLDVVHGAAHIAKWIGGVPVRLHNQSIVDVAARHSAASISSHYFQRGKGVLRQMLQSAATLPSGAEGLFSEYGIDSIAFFAVPAEGPHGFYTIGRILESMTRAFNNLTERLHASFLLYLLPEPFQFLPVATYLSAPILIGAALTIAGLRIWRNLNSKASMSLLAMFVTYAIGGLLLSLDRMQINSNIIAACLAVALMSLLPVDSDCAAAVLPLECLTCGMLISVTSILNYGIGSAMAILGGLPSLVAVYTYASRRQGSIAKRLLLLIALSVCVLSTLKAYSGLRPALYQLSGIAPVIFNLGLVPLWLQLAFVA